MWQQFFVQELQKDYFAPLIKEILKEYEENIVYPPKSQLWLCVGFINYYITIIYVCTLLGVYIEVYINDEKITRNLGKILQTG